MPLLLGCAGAVPRPTNADCAAFIAKLDYNPETTGCLAVQAPAAATVSVDHEVVALPVAAPFIALPAGSHELAVSYNGHGHWQQPVSVAPSQLVDVVAEPEETLQRKLAYASIGTAGAAAAAAIVLGVLAVVEFRRSRDLLFDGGGLSSIEDLEAYQDAVSLTDDYRVGSGTAGGVALGLFVVGATLFVFDEPAAPSVNLHDKAGQAWLRVGF